jgi:hypothetical protein
MTVTPAAGTYQVSFSGYATQSNANGVFEYAIFNGATRLLHSTRIFNGVAAVNLVTQTQGIVVADGVNAVTIQWRKTGGLGTMSMNARSMFLLRVS